MKTGNRMGKNKIKPDVPENADGNKRKTDAPEKTHGAGSGRTALRTWLCALAGGLFMGFTSQWGSQLEKLGNVDFTALTTWLIPLLTAAAAAPLLAWGTAFLEKRTEYPAKGGAAGRKNGQKSGVLREAVQRQRSFYEVWEGLPQTCRFLAVALCLFLSWLPVFLAVYPGFFAYDATDELLQVQTGSYVTRHPLLHVLLLGKTVSGMERLTGSYNMGIAVYVLLQMAGMALLLSWELGCIKRLGAGRLLRGMSFCFFAFFPVIPMYVLCTSKDIWYTAGMLAVVTKLCLLIKERETRAADGMNGKEAGRAKRASRPADRIEAGQAQCASRPADRAEAAQAKRASRPADERKGRVYWFGLGCALFVMAVFRNNGFYVFLVMLPVLLFLAGRKNRKKMAVTAGVVLFAVLAQNAALKAALKPVDTGTQETLTVPIQQLARTWNYSPEVFSAEDRETLFEILPQEVLERYTPKLSDLVKIDFCTENYEEDPGRYQKLWLSTGSKAPFTYMNAWLMTSYGFWYPDASIDVYNGWRNYVKSSWFSFETEEPGVRDSRFPWLEEQYRKISLENIVQEIPVIGWLFSPGFLCWIFVLSGLFLTACGRWRECLAFAPVYLNWLTVLLGPTYLVRYVLIFWFALPLLISVCRLKRADNSSAKPMLS